MNKIHRTVWNSTLGTYVAAPETARKRSSSQSGGSLTTRVSQAFGGSGLRRSVVALCMSAGFASAALAGNVLYYVDSNLGTSDSMLAAFTAAGYSPANIAVAAGSADFVSRLASGPYDFVVYSTQNNGPGAEQAAVQSYINAGGKVVGSTWYDTGTKVAMFGAQVAGQNDSTIVSDGSAIFTGVASPIALTNPGWGVYSQSYTGLAGTVTAGQFGAASAVVFGNAGQTALVGPLNDTYSDAAQAAEFLANVMGYVAPGCSYASTTDTCKLTSDSSLTRSLGRGSNNTLQLGGAQNFAFDTGLIGSTATFRNFQQYEKTDANTVALTGSTTALTPWTVSAGTLSIADDASLGAIAGTLTLNGGTLQTTADVTSMRAIALGAGGGTLTPDAGTTLTHTGQISGAGALTMSGAGTLVFGAANNTHSGSTTVAQGILRAGVSDAFSAASATNVAAGATLDTAGFNQTVAALTNAGTVSLLSTSAGSTLTVNGNYVGNNGLLVLGTVLGGDASASDRLVVNGSASGATAVQVTNLGGLGAQTTGDGIQIISATGGIAANAFSLAGPVSAGAYDYRLNTTGTAAYLSNTIAVAPVDPAPPAGLSIPLYRTEASLYAALPEQLRATNLAMLANLHQRAGDDGASTVSAGGTVQSSRQAWGRVISTERTIAQTGTVSPTSQGRLNGFQAGTDLWAAPSWRTGVYVGQLDGDMSVTGFARGLANFAAGSNDLRSQYLGAYATWKDESGLYVDGVLQAGRHRVSVNPVFAAGQSVKGDSLLASIEAGKAFSVAPNWTVEPQLQLVHQQVSLDDASIVGARVQQDSHNGLTVRAGLRIKGQIETSSGALQPYARVNVYKRSSGTDITRFANPFAITDITTRTGGTSSELAAGATWQLTPAVSMYGEVGKLWASGGNARTGSSVNASAGVKVRW